MTMERDERDLWNKKYSEGSHTSLDPDPFLLSAWSEFLKDVAPGKALDVAGGVGRHSLWLAERGWQVKLVDISEVGIQMAKENARRHRKMLSAQPGAAAVHIDSLVETEVVDLNSVHDLGNQEYDLIVVFFYLQRGLFPALISALKPEGFLIYKTYSTEQRRFAGGPTHPLHLLKPNELLHAFSSLRVLHYHETIHERGVVELIAQK